MKPKDSLSSLRIPSRGYVDESSSQRPEAKTANLPTSDPAGLVRFLIHPQDDEVDAEVEAAWDAELARREAEIFSGKAVGEPAGSVFAELRKKYS